MNDRLKHKMYDYEVKPPKEIWDQIETALDEEKERQALSSKLYNLETPPPVTAWQHINNKLEEDEHTPASLPKTIPMYFRYAAAAVIVGVLIFTGIKLLNTNPGTKEVATTEKATPEKDTSIQLNNDSPETNTLSNSFESDEIRDEAALEESKHTIAKNDLSTIKRIKLARESYLTTPALYIQNTNEETNDFLKLHYSEMSQFLFPNTTVTEEISDRYITLRSPDGNFFRMSKKFAPLICCISGEDQDAGCKDQLQKWREKIASSPVAPAPGNFMDILSLITSLQEDKN